MIGETDMLSRFERVHRLADGSWMVRCPHHDDRTPSLHITLADDCWLVDCKAGCAADEVVAAAGLAWPDLFRQNGNGQHDVEAVYGYVDEQGRPLYEVVRFAGKKFRQRRPDGSWGLGDTRRVLYRLPRILEAIRKGEDIMIVEGERDVHTLERLGIAATCNPMGAGKWRREYSETLRGAKVTIVADRDDPGREHARQVADSLHGVAASIVVVEMSIGKDVTDLLGAGKSLAGLVDLTDQFLSSPRHNSLTNESQGLPFMRMGDAIAHAPPEPNWNWEGYVTAGEVSLFAGRPKVGKSTMLFGLIAAMLNGQPFVGRRTNCKGVLLLTEESTDTLAEKARRFGIADHSRLHVLLRRQVQASWLEIITGARGYCREQDLDVLILDTFDKWTGLRGDDENKSGPVLQAFEPLMLAAGEGLAIVVVTHQRKARGEHGEAVRGTNALVGSVDIIVELERVSDMPHARALIGTSRHTKTPEELAIELVDDGYVDRGNVEAMKERLDTETILGALNEDDWVTAEEVVEATEIPKGTVHKRLNELRQEERVDRDGAGKKGSPYRWKIHSSRGYPLGDERKNGGPPEAEEPAGAPTVADLSDEEIIAIFPGSTIEHSPSGLPEDDLESFAATTEDGDDV